MPLLLPTPPHPPGGREFESRAKRLQAQGPRGALATTVDSVRCWVDVSAGGGGARASGGRRNPPACMPACLPASQPAFHARAARMPCPPPPPHPHPPPHLSPHTLARAPSRLQPWPPPSPPCASAPPSAQLPWRWWRRQRGGAPSAWLPCERCSTRSARTMSREWGEAEGGGGGRAHEDQPTPHQGCSAVEVGGEADTASSPAHPPQPP